ncbi:glutathione S-transferase, C-terminal domain protein [Bacteriovorax sp. BSW11_IV]|uniref:glutathione S-transferase family protein n=1 Tax=Bacteriovorax sp. BSW11_IV TaxID=1353529 RepID=UPI000389EA6E|nr:glutathione S-transferase family protein [Bacteriovorax sp. BSW11_IV]EQC48548.1 glutathione S-transferase, C-terminal domain protein [Bacteriovorax sp. BSW11_IV]
MIELVVFKTSKKYSAPNFSPFCVKLQCAFKAMGIPFKEIPFAGNPKKMPKGKLPIIRDHGYEFCDSELILKYMKEKYNKDLDSHLSAIDMAHCNAYKKMVEDHMGMGLLYFRWQVEENWSNVAPIFFAQIPAPLRKIMAGLSRRSVVSTLYANGMGRHSHDEVLDFLEDDFKALSTLLGDKKYFFGDQISSLDATVFGFITNCLQVSMTPELFKLASKYQNLVAFEKRIKKLLFQAQK